MDDRAIGMVAYITTVIRQSMRNNPGVGVTLPVSSGGACEAVVSKSGQGAMPLGCRADLEELTR